MSLPEIFDAMHTDGKEQQLFDLTTWCVVWESAFAFEFQS